MISFRTGAGLLGGMASPSPKRKVEVRFCCCCAYKNKQPVLLCCCYRPWCLAVPTSCFPQLPPRGQQARAQSSFSVREAAFWDAGMSNKSTLYRALHDGRPFNSWC